MQQHWVMYWAGPHNAPFGGGITGTTANAQGWAAWEQFCLHMCYGHSVRVIWVGAPKNQAAYELSYHNGQLLLQHAYTGRTYKAQVQVLGTMAGRVPGLPNGGVGWGTRPIVAQLGLPKWGMYRGKGGR